VATLCFFIGSLLLEEGSDEDVDVDMRDRVDDGDSVVDESTEVRADDDRDEAMVVRGKEKSRQRQCQWRG